MAVRLRKVHDDDWPTILALADAALPWDAGGNREWLENRKRFAGLRCHYLAEEVESGRVTGYGAVEEGPEQGSFRMFVVMAPALLRTDSGTRLYEKLSEELAALKAKDVWAREYAADKALIAFFEQRGFVTRERFTPSGYREMVVVSKAVGGE